MRVHHVDADGVELYAEDSGPLGAPAVLFGHSLVCDGRMFEHQVAALSERYRVINLDFRGHGRSGVPERAYSIYDQALDYGRVLDALAIERAAIVGLSMGAMAALRFAHRHPERVAAMVLMDTSHRPETRAKRLKYRLMVAAVRRIGMHPLIVRETTKILFGKSYRTHHPAQVDLWAERFAALDPEGISKATEMVVSRDDALPLLSSLRMPALVVVGAEDVATPPHYAIDMARRLPNARLERIARAGHLSTIEAPQATSALIASFLGRTWPASDDASVLDGR